MPSSRNLGHRLSLRGIFARRAQRVRDHWICAAFPVAQPLWIPAFAGMTGVVQRSLPALVFILLTLPTLACTSATDDLGATATPRTVFVEATRVPTVTPSPTPDLPTPTPTSTAQPEATPTSTPTPSVTPSPTATVEPLSEREAYCRDHALPTAKPESGETPTPVPTSPPGISDDKIPTDWIAKMDEIEVWVRNFYGVDTALVGDFQRRFVNEEVWKEWMGDGVEDWASDEDSRVDLWEQIYRTLTFLAPDEEYLEFIADYQGDRFVGVYNSEKREFVVQTASGEFDLLAELIYVHEYAHHVQNVKYDYPQFHKCYRADDDAHDALHALIEGDARRTEFEYINLVIGWDNLRRFFDEREGEGIAPTTEPKLSDYLDAGLDFTYGKGTDFIYSITRLTDCPNCELDREPIDEAFERPPYTTEQIYYEAKYSDGEGREPLILPEDVLGEEWELRSASTIGRSDWIALLATLADVESDEIGPELTGWRGDYGMLFEDDEGRALYLQVAEWENKRYIESLRKALSDQPRLKRIRADNLPDRKPFEDLYFWRGDTGGIAIGVELQPVDRFYTMFSAVGPDLETVEDAIYAARDNLVIGSSAGDGDTGWAD